MRQRGSEGGLVISWWRLYLPKTEESTQPIGVFSHARFFEMDHAGVTSVVVAGLVFLLATVGIVVAFFVFLVLFVVFGLAMRRPQERAVR